MLHLSKHDYNKEIAFVYGKDGGALSDVYTLGELKEIAQAMENPDADAMIRAIAEMGFEYSEPYDTFLGALDVYNNWDSVIF